MKRAITLLLFFGLLGALYGTLNAHWLHKLCFDILERKTGWVIQADDIDINPFRLAVRVRAANIQSKSKRQLYSADEVYVRVNVLSVVRGKIIISRLQIRNAYLSFEKKLTETKEDKPKKFTIEYISKIASKVAGNFAMQSISVESGQFGPVTIMIQKKNREFTDLFIEDFQFDLGQTLLRTNDLHVKARNFRVNEIIIASELQLDAELSGKQVTVKQLDVERPEGSYTAFLEARVQQDTIGGEIRIDVHIPKGFRQTLRGKGMLELRPPYVFLKPFEVKVGDVVVNASGQLNARTGEYDIDFDTQPTALDKIWAILQFPQLEKITGEASLAGKLKAKLPAFHVEGTVTAAPVTYEPVQFPSLVADVAMDDRVITWQSMMPSKEAAQFTTTGRILIEKDTNQPIIEELRAQFHDLKLDPLLGSFELGELGGVLNGKVELAQQEDGFVGSGDFKLADGHYKAIAIDSGEMGFKLAQQDLTIERLRFAPAGNPEIVMTKPLLIHFAPERITFSGDPMPGLNLVASYERASQVWELKTLHLQQNGNNFRANGIYRPNRTFELTTKGSLNAKEIARYRALFTDADGVLDLDLKLRGSVDHPQVSGEVRLRQVMLNIRGLSDPLRELTGAIHIQPNRIAFDSVSGVLGDGTFQIIGSMGMEGIHPSNFDLALRGEGLTYRLRRAMQVDFDADLSVKGSMPSPLLSGRVDLLSGRYYKPFILTKAVFAERVIKEEREGLKTDFFNEWRWDIQIRNSGDLQIENNVADVYLDGDLRLKGTTQRPAIEGVVTTAGGVMHYLGHDMEITEGALEFQDPIRINPILNLQAQEEITGSERRGLRSFYTVYVRLSGPLDNLQTSIWSSPLLDQSDVISLLAFGMTQAELEASDVSRGTLAVSILTNSLTSGFGGGIGSAAGVDISFASGEGSEVAISGVAVGKNLSDRLSIEFYTDIAPESAQRQIRSKYYLTDNIFLEGTNIEVDDENQFELNVSLQFKIR